MDEMHEIARSRASSRTMLLVLLASAASMVVADDQTQFDCALEPLGSALEAADWFRLRVRVGSGAIDTSRDQRWVLMFGDREPMDNLFETSTSSRSYGSCALMTLTSAPTTTTTKMEQVGDGNETTTVPAYGGGFVSWSMVYSADESNRIEFTGEFMVHQLKLCTDPGQRSVLRSRRSTQRHRVIYQGTLRVWLLEQREGRSALQRRAGSCSLLFDVSDTGVVALALPSEDTSQLPLIEHRCEPHTQTYYAALETCSDADHSERSFVVANPHDEPQLYLDTVHTHSPDSCNVASSSDCCRHWYLIPSRDSLDNGYFIGSKRLRDEHSTSNISMALRVANPCSLSSIDRDQADDDTVEFASVRAVVYTDSLLNKRHVHHSYHARSVRESPFTPKDRVYALAYVHHAHRNEVIVDRCNGERLDITGVELHVRSTRVDGDKPTQVFRRQIVYNQSLAQNSDEQLVHIEDSPFECSSQRLLSWKSSALESIYPGAHVDVYFNWSVVPTASAVGDETRAIEKKRQCCNYAGSSTLDHGVPDRFAPHASTYHQHVSRRYAPSTSAHANHDSLNIGKRSIDSLASALLVRDSSEQIERRIRERYEQRKKLQSSSSSSVSGALLREDAMMSTSDRRLSHASVVKINGKGISSLSYATACLRGYHYVDVLHYCVRDYSEEAYPNISFWAVGFSMLLVVGVLYACAFRSRRRQQKRNGRVRQVQQRHESKIAEELAHGAIEQFAEGLFE